MNKKVYNPETYDTEALEKMKLDINKSSFLQKIQQRNIFFTPAPGVHNVPLSVEGRIESKTETKPLILTAEERRAEEEWQGVNYSNIVIFDRTCLNYYHFDNYWKL